MPQRFGLHFFYILLNHSTSFSTTKTFYFVYGWRTHTQIYQTSNQFNWISSLLHFKYFAQYHPNSQRAKDSEAKKKIAFQSLVPVSISLAAYCIHFIFMYYCMLVHACAREHRQKNRCLLVQRHFSFSPLSPSFSQQDQNIIITKFVWCILKYLLCLQAVKELCMCVCVCLFFVFYFIFYFFLLISQELSDHFSKIVTYCASLTVPRSLFFGICSSTYNYTNSDIVMQLNFQMCLSFVVWHQENASESIQGERERGTIESAKWQQFP